MILWLNGAFGSGKTVTAAELERRIAGSFVYDPENIGFFLRKNTPPSSSSRYADFQDDPLWRKFNLDVLLDICATFDGVIIIPMTIVKPEYYDYIIGGLRRNGVDVRHFVIGARREVLLKRQRSRFDFGNSWAAAQLDRCIGSLTKPPFEGYTDTSEMKIRQVAEKIAESAGITLAPSGNAAVRLMCRLRAQIKAMR